ncbi:MAG TPA: LysM domain-containing protein [Chloroflexota bacterium]|nr:LysM domain-containing protein [Chloroflexota bacterium]
MDPRLDSLYAHVDQPAYEQNQVDHNISRVAIFFVCFLTIGVFYFTLVNFPIARLLPFQQIQQLGQVVNSLNPSSSRAPVASDKPTGALGGSQIGATAAPSAGAASVAIASSPPAVSSPAAAAASVAPAATAKPSASSAASAPAGGYTVQSGDTLLGIARQFNTTVQAIADANKMTSNATLRVGQKLVIPKN